MNRVYVTGDCHGDWSGRFSSRRFPIGSSLDRGDTIIVCGDFGLWNDSEGERYWLNWLANKPYTIAFVDGNHENFDRLYGNEFPVVDFHNGKAHKIRENVYHLMRGYVFKFAGKSFWAFGGARSHDIQDGILDPANYSSQRELNAAYRRMTLRGKLVRIKHQSWWGQEMPSSEEMQFGTRELYRHGGCVDYIITHCCPTSVENYISNGLYESDELNDYFEEVAAGVTFDHWYFGHYHDNVKIGERYTLLYDDIAQIL